MTPHLHGVIPPLVTPMRADEDLDLPRLRQLIDRLIGRGVHGVFVMGTTGEFFALDEAEKQTVVAAAVEQTAGRVPVLAGTGAETSREAVRLTRLAEREGADAVSVITPYFVSPTQAEIADHFRRVAESTPLPVVLYNNPGTCGGVRIDPETVARLAELPNVVGIKDSSGDLQNLIECVRLTPPEFAVFQGRDTLISPALQFGARGAVPGTCNVAPDLCVGVYEAHRRGDLDEARRLQGRLSPIRLGLALGTAPGMIKVAMGLTADPFPCGPSRGPLAVPPADKLQKLRAVLAEAGV